MTERPETSPSRGISSLESSYKKKLDEVLTSSINPSTLYTFYDDALESLITTLSSVTTSYKEIHPDTPLVGRELEDTATQFFHLPSIPTLLDAISERQEDLKHLQTRIIDHTGMSPEVFVPPSDSEKYGIVQGSGRGLEEKKLIPRLETLIYILEHDLGVTLEDDVKIVSGVTTNAMMREEPYIRVDIKSHDRLVYLCNEEGNATFVFDAEVIKKYVPDIEMLDKMDKTEYKSIIASDQSVGVVLRYHADTWRDEVLQALSEPFSLVSKRERSIISVKKQSDFDLMPKRREGWESASSLQRNLSVDKKTIEKFVEQFKPNHPEWFEIQKTSGSPAERYHPELVAKIIEYFTSIPQKKEGWNSLRGLRETRSINEEKAKHFIKPFRVTNPEWFEIQKTFGKPAERYHPELVAKIIEHFTTIPQKKEGWEGASSLKVVVSVDRKSIEEYAGQSKILHPEWFEMQKKNGRPIEHYHPDLVTKIIEHFTAIPKKKEGWESASTLVVAAGSESIRKFTEQFKTDHSEWFEMQKTGARLAEHYHPELAKRIKEHFPLRNK